MNQVATHVGHNRLLKLAQYLRTVPAPSFRMSNWAHEPAYSGNRVSGDRLVEIEHISQPLNECGFAGCAVGHACSIKAFRRAGLSLVRDWQGIDGSADVTPVFRGKRSFAAAEYFFSITYDEAQRLFSPDTYAPSVRPATVAKAIEKFVADQKKAIAKK